MKEYYSKSILLGWISIVMVVGEYASLMSHVNGFIGMDWGRMSPQRIVPSMVVDMLLQNGISEVKLFSSSDNVLEAFQEADIGITVTVPNEWFKLLSTVDDCKMWLKKFVVGNVKKGVNIRYLSMGAQPLSPRHYNETFRTALPVLKNMVEALKQTDFGGKVVKPTMSHTVDIMDRSLKPSETNFNPDTKDVIVETLRVLRDNDSPVMLDTFPLLDSLNFTNDIEFAFFYNNSTSKFMDGEFTYRNIFEVMFDKFMCALDKNGLSGIKVFGGQLGWPTDGIQHGNLQNAQRFHNGLLKYFLRGKGTPRHPKPIDVYLHNIADESKLKYNDHTKYYRHWGLYRFDGQPKYNIDFTGTANDSIKSAKAKGITYMPRRWCIINKDLDIAKNLTLVKEQTDLACSQSDCTDTACADLDVYSFASYAFNMHFQTKDQKISNDSCVFQGLGMIIPENPSTPNCQFPIGIIPAEEPITNGSGTSSQISFTILIILLSNIFLLMLISL